jgi:putative Mg2+ transporter-C (MgtC) family protein
VASHAFSVANLNYRLLGDGEQFEYRMVMRTLHAGNLRRLAEALNADPGVIEYRLSPTSD